VTGWRRAGVAAAMVVALVWALILIADLLYRAHQP
jgi:hypothetical protein